MGAPSDEGPGPGDFEALLPAPDGAAPLEELGRDELSVFVFLAFTDPELTELLSALGISIPGYRLEKLSGVQKADALADEVRARPAAAQPVLEKLRQVYEFPALEVVSLSPPVAEELGLLAVEDDAPVRMLWRLLADPLPEVRALATGPLQALSKLYYGGAGGAAWAPGTPRPAPQGAQKADGAGELRTARRQARESGQAQEKAQAKVEALQAQLKDARADLAQAVAEVAAFKRAQAKADAALHKAKEQLEKSKGKGSRAELEKTKKELEKATAAVAALEGQKTRLHDEAAALKDELETLKRIAGAAPQVPQASVTEDAPVEEAPTTWLKPHFTREFYDSLQGWDVRLQRAAFKQAFLLSENHRHPSLRAIPLEGLPGYFRVRVATDVRLIYRRTEGAEVELLSLIDREDLDRYVRQARTR